jgi:hypothetical protein
LISSTIVLYLTSDPATTSVFPVTIPDVVILAVISIAPAFQVPVVTVPNVVIYVLPPQVESFVFSTLPNPTWDFVTL